VRIPRLLALLLTLSVAATSPAAVAQSIDQLIEQGTAAQAADNYAQAELIWHRVIEIDPKNAIAYYNLGNALYKQGKLEEAIAAYHQTIQLNPTLAPAYYNLGIALYKQGKLEEAIAAYRQAIQLDPKDAAAYYNLGIALKAQGKLEEAIAAYRQAIQLDPKFAFAYNNLGVALYDQGKLEEAIAAYRQAIQLDPKDAVPYNGLGNALSDQGKLEDAIAAYRQAIQLDPKYAKAYNGLGNALSDQGKLEEAIAAYRQAIQLNPTLAPAYNNLGLALYYQGKQEEAIAAYRQAIQLDPTLAPAYNNLGLALYDQGKLEEAIAACRQALALPEDKSTAITTAHTLAHNNLGRLLQQQDKLEAAIAEFEQAVAIDPKFVTAQNNLKEAQRLLSLRLNPPLPVVDDRKWLPKPEDEPLVGVLRSVVRIVAEIPTGSNIGAGWVLKREGNTAWIVTNRHVVSDVKGAGKPSKKIELEFYSEPPPGQFPPRYPAKILQITAPGDSLDLALLEVTGIPDDIQPLPVHIGKVGRTTTVRVIGHPSNGGDWSAVPGEVSNVLPQEQKLQIVATLAEGNSGGPVINDQKQVVGLMVQNLCDRKL